MNPPAPPPPRRPAAPPLAGAVALLLCASGCLLFPQPRGTPERPTITSFEIEGTHAVSADELKEHLATQSSGRKYLVWPQPQHLDPDALANDRRRVVRYYQARGYYRATAATEVVPDGEGKVKVRIRVEEGPPVQVTQVDVAGLESAPEARAKLGKLAIAPGDRFTEEAYDKARGQIEAALTSTGWAKAEVSQEAHVDPGLDQAHVRYAVTPGERYKFGGVFVAGAAAIPRARIRSEAERATKPGATFDASELPQAQRDVFDLGVFGGVRVSEGPPDPRRKTIPVVVSVREAPFRTVRAGPGFTFQATRQEVDVIAGWAHRNWLGGLRKLNLDARAGYAWLPVLWQPQQHGFVGQLSADFTQPQLFTRYLDLNLHADVERGVEQAYNFVAERFRIGTPFRLGRLVQFFPSLNLELYQLSGQVSQADPTTGANLQLSTCPGQNPNVCLLSYLEQRIAIDLRDDPINTTRGIYLGVSFQEGFKMFGNGSTYFRVLPEARAFLSFGGGFVLATRARIGIIDSPGGTSDIPIVARFTSGGPNLMRGYYTRQLSPVLRVCSKPGSSVANCPAGASIQYLPIGGAGLVDGSVELRFPIAGSWAGAAFLDFGLVRLAAREALELDRLQWAVGLGVRYKTVFGPLRLDVAGRLPRPGGDQPGVEVLQLEQGAGRSVLSSTGTEHHAPIVSVHLSIGESF